MGNERMNTWEVIRITRDLLNSICVPVGMIENVGKPIQYAVRNLNVCLEAEKKAEQKPEQIPEPKTEEGNNETANG